MEGINPMCPLSLPDVRIIYAHLGHNVLQLLVLKAPKENWKTSVTSWQFSNCVGVMVDI